jgi:hypothetical protein
MKERRDNRNASNGESRRRCTGKYGASNKNVKLTQVTEMLVLNPCTRPSPLL